MEKKLTFSVKESTYNDFKSVAASAGFKFTEISEEVMQNAIAYLKAKKNRKK